MKIKSQAKWLRISPRKLGRVATVVRGRKAFEALQLLSFMPQKGARILEKVIKSAIANAKNNYKLAEESLVVVEAFANKAVNLKRFKPRARGRADSILKRTSHVTVFVSPPKVTEKKAPKEEQS
jgi:large subunit ribosomal protein L22